VERNVWLFAASRFINRPFLAGMTPNAWELWTDYFLGSKVYLLETVGSDGTKKPLQPPWAVILSYELKCRKNVVLQTQETAITFVAAMALAIRDPELKELAFTSTIAHMGRTVKPTPTLPTLPKVNLQNPNWPLKKDRSVPYQTPVKGAGKNKGKGKGKGRGKGKGKQAKNTPDGRQICFSYNSASGCSEPCPDSRIHVCRNQGCLGLHSAVNCPMSAVA